jgi:hypothetical protein
MSTYYDAVCRSDDNAFYCWEEGEEMSSSDAATVLNNIQIDLMDHNRSFARITLPGETWTVYVDSEHNIPLCAVKW